MEKRERQMRGDSSRWLSWKQHRLLHDSRQQKSVYIYKRERESEKRHVLRMLPCASLVNIDREDYTDTSGLLKGVRAGGDGRVCVRPPLRRTDTHASTWVCRHLKSSPFALLHASWFHLHSHVI